MSPLMQPGVCMGKKWCGDLKLLLTYSCVKMSRSTSKHSIFPSISCLMNDSVQKHTNFSREDLWNYTYSLLNNNTNLVLSDSGATLKFKFCMLKNTTHADFQLKISTPGILAAIRSFGKILWNYSTGVNGFQKFLSVVDGHEKTNFWL